MTVTNLPARRTSSAVSVPATDPRPSTVSPLRLLLIALSVAAFPLAYLLGLILNLTTT